MPLKEIQCLKDLLLVKFRHSYPAYHVPCIVSDGEQPVPCLTEMKLWTTGCKCGCDVGLSFTLVSKSIQTELIVLDENGPSRHFCDGSFTRMG